MPNLDKAERRERKRQKQKKMIVNGRGLLTDTPNFERRMEKEWEKRKSKNRGR